MNTSGFNLNLAVVIGINDYHNGIPTLGTAKQDAEEIAKILENNYNYQVYLLTDGQATGQELKHLLETKLPQQLEQDNPSRLVFYFAGHGIALNGDDGPQGYLIPHDAKLGDVTTYLPMQQMEAALTKLSCRHCLVILDCCFAGAFRWSSTRKLSVIEETIHKERFDRFIKDPAWQVITSAASDQFALDNLDLNSDRRIAKENSNHSPFAAALMEALRGEADAYPPAKNGQPSGDGIITATELYLYLRDAVEVPTDARNQRQTPQIWCLKKHDKGEFIFLPPGHELNLPPAPTLDSLEENNPYRGLKSYETKDSDLFFGRTSLIEKLCHTVSDRPLTVVLGASGSGKSSLVKAGLIPSLSLNRVYQWHSLSPIRPGESPLNSLNTVLKELGNVSTEQVNSQIFIEAITVWSKANPQTKLLLVVDQLEELITLCRKDEEKQQFLEILATLINTFPDVVRLVVTLRSDFEPQLRNTPLESLWQSGRFVVPAMTREELRSVIEEPASAKVVYFESLDDPDKGYLVDRLIDEVAGMPGALPLLSFALSELYLKLVHRYLEAQNAGDTVERAITWDDYDALGGVTKSLTQRADEIYEELVKVDPAYEKTIRNVMLRMVAVGGELARRQVPELELQYPEPENGRVQKVLDKFLSARLLVSGTDAEGKVYIEPAHDVLVRSWSKLIFWLKERQNKTEPAKEFVLFSAITSSFSSKINRANRQKAEAPLKVNLPLQRELTTASSNWWNEKKQSGFLWNADPRLDQLVQIQASKEDWLNVRETNFVGQSTARKRQNKILLWGSVGVVTLGSLAFSTAIWLQLQATSLREKATRVENLLTTSPVEALVLAIEATGKSQSIINPFLDDNLLNSVKSSLFQAFVAANERNVLVHSTSVASVAISADGKTIVSGSKDGTLKLWDNVGKPIGQSFQHKGDLVSAAISADGKTIVSGSKDGTLKLWDNVGKPIGQSFQHKGNLVSVAISADGKTIVSGSKDGTLKLWDNVGKPIGQSFQHKGDLVSVAISADGKTIVSADFMGDIKCWNNQGQLLENSFKNDDSISSIAISPNGQFVAIADMRGIELWDRKSISKLDNIWSNAFLDAPKSVYSVAFSPDGQYILSGSSDGTLRLWDIKGDPIGEPLIGYSPRKINIENFTNHVNTVAVSYNAQKIVSGHEDGTVRLWDTPGGLVSTKNLDLKGDFLRAIGISPDGNLLIIGSASNEDIRSNDQPLRIWNLPKNLIEFPFQDYFISINSIATNREGQLLTGTRGGTLSLWDFQNDEYAIL
jgi:WD40 repeat protein